MDGTTHNLEADAHVLNDSRQTSDRQAEDDSDNVKIPTAQPAGQVARSESSATTDLSTLPEKRSEVFSGKSTLVNEENLEEQPGRSGPGSVSAPRRVGDELESGSHTEGQLQPQDAGAGQVARPESSATTDLSTLPEKRSEVFSGSSTPVNEENLEEQPGPSGPGSVSAPRRVGDELESGAHTEGQRQPLDAGADRKEAFKELLSQLQMERYGNQKLSRSDVLEICPENLNPFHLQALEDVPWHVLRKIMALNSTARNTTLKPNVCDDDDELGSGEQGNDERDVFSDDDDTTKSINPLDVFCILLHCSDPFLQQDIMLKGSMCQFALPLLWEPPDKNRCTLMLWAMRDIVKRWRPQTMIGDSGYKEESLVLTQMPTFAFVRIGRVTSSKSKTLNDILSPLQQYHDFFIHRDMESGNIPRRISEGLVEISWYLPSGRGNFDIFPDPIAILNLRGDIMNHCTQFCFLSQASSAVFVFVENISEPEFELLSSCKGLKTKYFFIFPSLGTNPTDTKAFCKKLMPVLGLSKSQILLKTNRINDSEFVKRLQSAITSIVDNDCKKVSIEDLAATARELAIHVDEDCKECMEGKKYAREITEGIQDVAEYKEKNMLLQNEFWRKITEVEKECCTLKNIGNKPVEHYKSDLKFQLNRHRLSQRSGLSDGVNTFLERLGQSSQVEKHYFLKWMTFFLDLGSRNNLLKLHAEYKQFNIIKPSEDLAQLDQKIARSSLGIEHFMRELGQIYEAHHSISDILPLDKKYSGLRRIGADLLLEGFPLELIDGNVSNIPLQWVTDVLKALSIKLGENCRMIVLSVLGVQSTGKSTLLNTLFGLQFSVSSGRCTRGAFMLLLKVKENFRQSFGCDCVLVIDTEGLKAPELTLQEDSYRHDNELATLVIGLSDITIINLAMEHATEMKDVLEIAVHAFLRMGQIRQKTNCQFVHQNVSDISANQNNMRDRKLFLEQLNEMTKAAVRMERQSQDINFCDIMVYDPEKNNWYMPGLWHGMPPMAPVNMGYSENIYQFKMHLLKSIDQHSHSQTSSNIATFARWVKNMLNGVKHEHFIFSFRNILVAEAYNQLSIKYSDWEWTFRKELYLWMSKAETSIQNQFPIELQAIHVLEDELENTLDHEEKKILNQIRTHYEGGGTNVHLIEKYREDFTRSVQCLKNEVKRYTINKLKDTFEIQKGTQEINSMQTMYREKVEQKVSSLLEVCKKRNVKLKDEELEEEFAEMWKNTMSNLHFHHLKRREIKHEMFQHLRLDLSNRSSAVNTTLHKSDNLTERTGFFKVHKRHFSQLQFQQRDFEELTHLARSLTRECVAYTKEKARSRRDYDETYSKELLHMVNDWLKMEAVKSLHTAPCFEVELKRYILEKAVHYFQAMHERFIMENDLYTRLQNLKPQYLSTFKNIYLQKDEHLAWAEHFCQVCLKPAIDEHMKTMLGLEIVEDVLHSEGSLSYSSRTFFQFNLLKELLEKKNFESYLEYIINYEEFTKKWIESHVSDQFQKSRRMRILEERILRAIIKEVNASLRAVIEEADADTIPAFLETTCKMLEKHLVISKDTLKVALFKNEGDVTLFSDDVLSFLSVIEKQILDEWDSRSVETKLTNLPIKPQEELFRKVFGCGKQCPFCMVPCEAGGQDHKEHFASIHRPQGLCQYKYSSTRHLVSAICSSLVISKDSFHNKDTGEEYHPYRDYQKYYPNWRIQPDSSIEASDYWKFIFKTFYEEFVKEYDAKPGDLPNGWVAITETQALRSLQEVFNMTK
ncbi:interferon-induced very large GTPase 1-like [Lissotriton helveticus]